MDPARCASPVPAMRRLGNNQYQQNARTRAESTLPTTTGGTPKRSPVPALSPMNSPSVDTRSRTFSVDDGVGELVKVFYERKLANSKKVANQTLEQTSKELIGDIRTCTLNGEESWVISVLEKLRVFTQEFIQQNSANSIKSNLVEIMKLKDDKQINSHALCFKYLNKIILTISSFSRLVGYLDIGAEIGSFSSWASKEFEAKIEEPSKLVVCRICEKQIPQNIIQEHTNTCFKLQEFERRCEDINSRISAELTAIQTQQQRDLLVRRETRRMTVMPGYNTSAELFDEYIERVMDLLSPEEFAQYRNYLRMYFNCSNDITSIDKLVHKVKQMFQNDDSKLYVLKGFIGFLRPEVQIRTCWDVMERIWKKEEAQLKSREEIAVLFNAGVESVIRMSPNRLDSFERVCKRLRQVQQLQKLFLTKSCEGELKASVERIGALIQEKFIIFEELYINNNQFAVLKSTPILDDEEPDTAPVPAPDNRSISIRDFEIVKPISRGSYGSVFLARKIATGDVYAIKVLKKSEMRTKNQQAHVLNERNVLALADNPFVVKMYYSFQTKGVLQKNLYMVMEYLNGGDCFSLLRELTTFDEDMARQYIAETVLALEYLHRNKIIHRDLKPDNMLIDRHGHVKLTDFGLSQIGLLERQEENAELSLKRLIEKEDEGSAEINAAGTPDYLAPEVFLGAKIGKAVDWWALGCIMYEFLIGITPFYGDNMDEIFQNILSQQIMWPGPEDDCAVSPEAMDLTSRLLAFEPSDRLGFNGADEIKQHPWFAPINWETLRNQPAVMVPQTDDIFDTSYFSARQEMYQVDSSDIAEDIEESAVPNPLARSLERFRGFSFINLHHLASANQSLT